MKTDHSLEPVRDGELAFHLKEYDEMNGDLLARWQEVMVVHRNKPCIHYAPLGPAMAFKCGPMNILASTTTPSGKVVTEDTVGDLKAHADSFRTSGFMETIMEEKKENSTLLGDWAKFKEMERSLRRTHARTLRNRILNAS